MRSLCAFLRDVFRYRPAVPAWTSTDLQPYLDALAIPAEHVGQTREELRQELITYLVEESANDLLYGTAYSDLWAPFEADMWSDA